MIRPDEIAWSIAASLCRDPAIVDGIAAFSRPGLPRAQSLSDWLARLAADQLLQALMQSTVVPSPALERLFTGLRHALLLEADALTPTQATLDFCASLAMQSFFTDYAWFVTEEESVRVSQLRDAIERADEAGTGSDRFMIRLAILGAYQPLHLLDRARDLPRTASDRPTALAALIRVQVSEPLADRELQRRIPSLTPIADAVSQQVRAQYEAHPYPRWVRAARAPIDARLSRVLRTSASGPSGPDVLVAGCGTGLQSVMAAYRYPGANILAIDLSLTSLAYAWRKSRELGLDNITYRQADILALGDCGRRFHVIESGGVLHHLADPVAGWRILVDLLHPAGIMNIGLYSRLARREVIAARTYIAERGYSPTADGIRRCRHDLLALPEGHPLAALRQFRDLYNVSECRDLLFHVQEHHYTLPMIADLLHELGLRFLGFLSLDCEQDYRRRFPDDPEMTSLQHWHQYEQDHPDTFAGMYNLLVQKL